MRLSEVLVRHANLDALANKKLPNKLAYAIAKNLAKLQPEVTIIEKRRIDIAESYAVKDEKGAAIIEGNIYKLGETEEETAANKKKFEAEYQEFLETETDIDIYKVPVYVLEMLEDARYDVLTAAQILALDFMIEDPQPAEGK